MSLDRFCRKPVISARPEETVHAVAHRMRDEHVGAVVVVGEGRNPIGIVTDRDLVCRVVAEGGDPRATRIADAMSGTVELLQLTDTIDTALHKMQERGTRRLPIVDRGGQLAGLVSLDDLVVLLSSELRETAGVIRENRGP